MNKLMMVASAAMVGTMVTGCAFSPETMPMTQRDQEKYVDAGATKRGAEAKAKVAVRTSVGGYKQYAVIGEALSSSLSDRISQFAFFDLIDRGNAAALLNEKVAGGEDASLANVESDFVVVAKIASITTRQMGTSTKIDVQYDFSWISMAENQKVIMKKSVHPTVRDAQVNVRGDVEDVLRRAAEKASQEFCEMISSKYAPPARVLQTRGSGEAARINIGQDYGLREGMEVEFYEIADNSEFGGSARDNSIIAKGEVKSVEQKAAWVQVFDFDKVNVRKGTYVRIPEQKESFSSKLMEKSGVNSML